MTTLWDILVSAIGTPHTMVGWVLMDTFVICVSALSLTLIALIPYLFLRRVFDL